VQLRELDFRERSRARPVLSCFQRNF